jgi:hypothetical protein
MASREGVVQVVVASNDQERTTEPAAPPHRPNQRLEELGIARFVDGSNLARGNTDDIPGDVHSL